MLAQTGEYLVLSTQTLTLKPVLATSWSANSTGDVWTFKIRQGVKFHNGAPLTADDVVYTYKLQTNPKSCVERAVRVRGVLSRPGAEGRRLHGGLPPGGAERELPVPDLLGQLQHDHHPEQLRPGAVAELVRRHRPVHARLLHAQGGRVVHPQRVLLGHQGAARADPVHVLRHPDPVDPRADRRDHRRPRAVLGDRRRGAAGRQLQRHQAEVERAPRAVDALRPGPVHRPAGTPGDRAHAQPAADRHRAVQGLRRPRQRQPVRAGLPVHQHQRRPARAEHQPGQVAAGGRRAPVGFTTQLITENFLEIPQFAQIVAQEAAAIGVKINLKVESSSRTTARPRSATPTGWTPP